MLSMLLPMLTTLEPSISPASRFEVVLGCFKALSDPHRLQILSYLATGGGGGCSPRAEGVCACDLEAVTGLSQPTISHHMKCLAATGLVRGQKRGKWMYYELEPTGTAALNEFLKQFG